MASQRSWWCGRRGEGRGEPVAHEATALLPELGKKSDVRRWLGALRPREEMAEQIADREMAEQLQRQQLEARVVDMKEDMSSMNEIESGSPL